MSNEGETIMSQAETPILSSVVAVYPRPRYCRAHSAAAPRGGVGGETGDLSIVGRDFQETEEPYGFVSRGDYAKAGAETTGRGSGGCSACSLVWGLLILPGLGFVVVAGPISRRRCWRH